MYPFILVFPRTERTSDAPFHAGVQAKKAPWIAIITFEWQTRLLTTST